MLKIVKAGIEVLVEDWPGRLGYMGLGMAAAGAMDHLALQLGNLVVKNPPGEAGLEIAGGYCRIEFSRDAVIAVCGGGKGIQRIDTLCAPAEMQRLLDGLRRVGIMAFASGDVYIEKIIGEARHIEVQFLADAEQSVLCLGERDCSIQRRYQKIIEESPSPAVSEAQRQALFSYTKQLIRSMNYTGAGTIEYLCDRSGSFYFMEINARLQVEHPVTEFVTGIDIVEQQIRIAAGERLAWRQEAVKCTGHAIECRIYAEDPVTFMPSPGLIRKLSLPDTVKNKQLRIDTAVSENSKIPPYYDPLLAKVIGWGETRAAAIEQLKSGLQSIVVEGIKTTIPADLEILEHPDFVSGDFYTDFLQTQRHSKIS